MAHLFVKLARKDNFRYVVEGDIKGCFDNINHQHILNNLLEWQIPVWATDYITKILKSKIFHNGQVYDSDTGTPQGGVISPLLANVALTSLDHFCDKYGRHSNPMVRYADDFVIVCKNEPEGKRIKDEIAEHLAEKTGLKLSDEKTEITHIRKGFNFLSFNFRKYTKRNKTGEILLIKPQKEKVEEKLAEWSEVINQNRGSKQESLIRILNPKLIGWAMYYRHIVSQETYSKVDYLLWYKLLKWAKRRHNNKSINWIVDKYFRIKQNKKMLIFYDEDSRIELKKLATIPIKRFVKINNSHRVYSDDEKTLEYWSKREFTNAYNQIITIRTERLYKKQKGLCYHCNKLITQDDISAHLLHTHHLIPVSKDGTNDYSNLRLVHADCHKEIHGRK